MTESGPSILEAAVSRGYEPEEAQAQILALLRQVGQLEIEAAARLEAVKLARRQAAALAERNAALEDGLQVVSGRCGWRQRSCCDLECSGRAFCDVTGLYGIRFPRADDPRGKYIISPPRKSPLAPLCKGGEAEGV